MRIKMLLASVVFFPICALSPSSEGALVSTNMSLVQAGGTFELGNISIGKTAFAPNIEGQDGGTPTQPTGYGGVHTTTGVNNGVYGNTGAWLAGSANSFVGLNLGAPTTIASIAYGRDNIGSFGDRQGGLVTLQYTSVGSPGVATVDTGNSATGWQTIGTSNYTTTSSNGVDFFNANRHAFNFTPVTATGIRLITASSGRGIDEIELYSAPLATPTLAGGASIIQDETSNASGIGFPGSAIPAEPAPGNGGYRYDDVSSTDSFTWMPVLNAKNVTVEASWGVSFNHNRDVDYFFDPDGAGPLAEIALAQNLRQNRFADQASDIAVGLVGWSNFFTIGTGLDLTVDSVFRVTGTVAPGGVAPEALTSAVWRFTAVIPEPATMSLLGLGMLLLGRRRREAAVI